MLRETETVIGVDLGTSAIKGVLADGSGRVLRTAERAVVYARPAPGRVELDPESHWREVAGLLRGLAAAAPGPVAALALSGASGNTLLADVAGCPLTPIISWLDRRTEGRLPGALKGLTAAEVRQVTGWPCLESFPLAHLAWLREHAPETLEQAGQVCMNTDWLIFKLTGRRVMDHSTATPFHLQDQVGRRWHRPYLDRLGIRAAQLACLTDSGVVAGSLTPPALAAILPGAGGVGRTRPGTRPGLTTETRVVTGAFDHPSAARAVNVLEPGSLMLSCGTSWVGFLPCASRAALIEAELLVDPFMQAQGGAWAGMFSVPAIGATIDRYLAQFIAPDAPDPLRVFDRLAADAPAGAGGLKIDLLAPPRPVVASPAQIARGVMEGAARALNAHLERLRARGFEFTRAVMVGGPGRSPVWPGIVASITGLELTVGATHAGAQGAALLAAQGARSWRKENAPQTALTVSGEGDGHGD